MGLRTTQSMNVGREKRYVCMWLITCEQMSDLKLLMYRMNGTRHCARMGRHCCYRILEKKPRVDLASCLERIEEFIHRRLGKIPNDCLRFEDN